MAQLQSIKRQLGITLLEVMVSLAILAAVLSGISSLVNTYAESTKAALVAQHLTAVSNAARAYIKDNYSTVAGNATATTPALIRVPTLVAAGYLPTGFNYLNGYNHRTCVLVLEPSANRLNALVVAEGGTALEDIPVAEVVGLLGGSGGAIYSSATTTIGGALGSWSLPVGNFANANSGGTRCNGTTAGPVQFTAGHPMVALWFEDGDSTSGMLYRDAVPGRPELNQMNVPLIMASEQTLGGACATLGAIARDATGKLLSCNGALWKGQGSTYWEDPVANFAALPTCDAATQWQTRVVQTPTVGTGSRAYTCNGAGSWQALALDDNGSLYVAGSATVAGALAVNGNTTLGSTAANTVTIPGNASINQLSGNLEVTAAATVGTACTPNGRLAVDTVGLLLSCQSGTWQKASGSIGTGYSALFSPYKGKSTSCSLYNPALIGKVSVQVTAAGVVQVKEEIYPVTPWSSGWINGTSYVGPYNSMSVSVTPNGISGYFDDAGTPLWCSALWPWT